jgi:hypothetical protein
MFNTQGIVPQLPKLVESIIQSMTHWKTLSFSERGRVTILNCYLLPRLFYVSMVEDMTPATLARLNRAMRAFIWKREEQLAHFTMSLDRMERSLECGGLNLTSVSLRIASQRIWLMLQVQQSDDWWAQAWRHQLNSVASNDHHWSSDHFFALSSRVPKGSLIQSCCLAASKREAIDQLDIEASAGTIYKTISTRSSMKLTSTQRQRATDPQFMIDFRRVFERIWKTPARRRIQMTFWKMTSNALPRIPHGKQPCPWCFDPETTNHLFQECGSAQYYFLTSKKCWQDWTGRTLDLSGPSLYNLGPSEGTLSVEVVYILATVHLIWRERCRFLHDDDDLLMLPSIRRYFKTELERAVNMAASRLTENSDIDYFKQQWLFDDLFEIQGSFIYFNSQLE